MAATSLHLAGYQTASRSGGQMARTLALSQSLGPYLFCRSMAR